MWYERDKISVVNTPIERDKIINLTTLDSDGSYTDISPRRWSIIDRTGIVPVVKIISTSYYEGFDSFNEREDEIVTKYLNDEYVSLLSLAVDEQKVIDWDGTAGIFFE